MHISIGSNIINGPWGGGNQFANVLATHLTNNGHKVHFDLRSPDLDLILLTTPFRWMKSCAYTDNEIQKYIRHVNSRAIVVHRINDCDESRNTINRNRRIKNAGLIVDACIFVSKWLSAIYRSYPCNIKQTIYNGSDQNIFSCHDRNHWNRKEPLRLVTHHWSASWNKGFDTYKKIDRLLEDKRYRNRILFTYIGNLPKGFHFKNANHCPPPFW